MKLKLSSEINSIHIYSKLHFHHTYSVVPRSDNDFYASLITIMLNDYVFFSPLSSENISAIGDNYYYYLLCRESGVQQNTNVSPRRQTAVFVRCAWVRVGIIFLLFSF